MNLTDLETIKRLLKSHNLWAKKFLGQNFLVDPEALTKIVETAEVTPQDHIIEIGPGLGTLTQQLATNAKQVTSIELDHTLLPILKETLANHNNVEILQQDALQFTPPNSPYKVVANIPYNITSPLINHFLQTENPPTTLTLLVQKEVAEKICLLAPKMSVLSLQVALFANATYVKTVPSSSFHPAPKVDSAILHLQTHNQISQEEAKKVLKLAHRAFKQGRKKLSNTLPELQEKLTQHNLNNKRPQHLSIADWQKLIS